MSHSTPQSASYEYVLHDLNAPDVAVDVLRRILPLAASDAKSALFLFGVPFSQSHSDVQWRTLVENGLLQLLLDFLLAEDILEFYSLEDGTRASAPDVDKIVSKQLLLSNYYELLRSISCCFRNWRRSSSCILGY